MIVTEKSHPVLFQALEMISHDRGSQAGHESYEIIDEYSSVILDELNKALDRLSESQLETFCIGEESEKIAIMAHNGMLMLANAFLDDFFHDFTRS